MINKSEQHKCDRQFRWISSVSGDPEILENLNQKMAWFYGQQDGRKLYQTMLDTQDESVNKDSVCYLLLKYIYNLQPDNVLEIGCGDGRLYRQLRNYGYSKSYTGIEVAQYIIDQNNQRHSDANWRCATAYEIPFPNNEFDVCFSFYVLEHLVYPETALKEMIRLLKPGGRLILVFPDFSESRRFPSQKLGFSPGRASEKLKTGRVLDAIISLYDSRWRLPRTLEKAYHTIGSFPVNIHPLCLSYPNFMGADVDAVYISSKKEIFDWAVAHGDHAEYPYGTTGEFSEHTFIVINKEQGKRT